MTGARRRPAGKAWRQGLRAAVTAAAVTAACPAVAQVPETPEAPAASPISVGSDRIPDAAIAERLRDIASALPGFEDVIVEVRSGVITLEGRVAETADADRLESLSERIDGVVAVRNELEATRDLGERLLPAFSRIESRFRQTMAAVPLVLLGLLAFFAIAGLGILLTGRWAIYDRLAPNAFIAQIYRQTVRIAFVFLALGVTLDLIGATALLGTILGAAGILGLAIGFGVRDTIENFVASVMLSVRQPFAPNDLVEIEGELGRVVRLTSRATVLLSLDGNHVRLPNSVVFKSKIVNYSREPQRRFVFDLGVDADADLAAARTAGLEAVARLDFVLDDPPVQGWIEEVGESNVVLRFAGWINQETSDFALARGEAIRAAKDALERAGFTLPEPIYRLRFDASPAAEAGAGPGTVPRPSPPASAAAAAPKDAAIEQKVEADRRSAGTAGDLLRPGAPQE